MSGQRASPGSVTITPVPTVWSHHVVPPWLYPFPLKFNSTQPLRQGRWVRARERKGKLNQSRAGETRPAS